MNLDLTEGDSILVTFPGVIAGSLPQMKRLKPSK